MPILKLSTSACQYTLETFGHDKTIIFSNSLGTDLSMWEYQMDILSHHFNVLRLDTRGHGQSDINQHVLSIADLGTDIIDLMDALDLDKVHFCGLSMGGLVGQWLGINHSQRFEKIILSNTAAKIGNESGWNDRISQVAAHGLHSILSGTAERWFTSAFRASYPEVETDILARFEKTSLQGYIACCAAVRDADFMEQLYDLEVPTLIISGVQDQVTTVADGKLLQKRIPVARHVSLDAAHLSNVECAEEFAKHILHFSAQ
ncbi:3-oxoadipate enol-lactonase [Pedobacter sp. CAN_A7]|uniref:3-oxoadipate enol-lactonase n=1 Tax=Pedobacter sp. CAN_A7 TaxID=2787722 RepID=UPI0018C96606